MQKVAVVGATGFTGEELVKVLLDHPRVKLTSLTAKVDKSERYQDIFGKFIGKTDIMCKNLDVDEVGNAADFVFLALPHGVSMKYAGAFLKKGKKVIDLSADYRLKDVSMYHRWYNIEHTDKENIQKAVYGLPEVYKNEIKKAQLIANPGCYSTVSLLCCLPLVSKDNFGLSDILIDAKSGITGAGRKRNLAFHFSEVNENMKAYKINIHQHIPEIEQELGQASNKNIKIVFTPHVVPLNRGILATTYIKYKEKVNHEEILRLYKEFYKDAPFVKILDSGKLPEIKNIANTNYCHIGINVFEDKGLIVVVGAIDNLLKGASGQAIENMNIMSGFKQEEGLL